MENINVDELKAMLAEAYEEGYRGYMGMKDECVARIVGEFLSSRPSSPEPFSTFSASSFCRENIPGHHYVYCTTAVPSLEMVRREEVV